jgi:hypothetical protein
MLFSVHTFNKPTQKNRIFVRGRKVFPSMLKERKKRKGTNRADGVAQVLENKSSSSQKKKKKKAHPH